MFKRLDLEDYQLEAIDWIIEKPKCGLFLEMGLGKTASTLTAFSDLIDNQEVKNILIIAPLRVANSVWEQESQEWEHLKHLKFSNLTGDLKQRLENLRSKANFFIINKDKLVWLIEHCIEYKKFPFDSLIIDESSGFKSPTSQMFKALKKVIKYFKRIVLLTGTPSPNSLFDLWSQIYILDQGERLGKFQYNYKEAYFKPVDYRGFKWVIKPGSEQIIYDKLQDICLSMKTDEHIQLPEKIIEYIEIEPNKEFKDLYSQIENDYIFKIENETIEMVTEAVLVNKLLQVCNGAIYDENKNYHIIHDYKINKIKEIIDNSNENFLVAYNFKSDLERLLKIFPDAELIDKKGENIKRWNEGKIKILLAHPASAGHGLNLQKGGHNIIWFQIPWSLELYQQFNSRLYRRGQKNNVTIQHITMKGTVENRVVKVLNSKNINQNNFMNALRKLIIN